MDFEPGVKLLFKDLKSDLRKNSSREKAAVLRGFFKTGRGQYGYGDIFIGITVPVLRLLSRKYADLPMAKVLELLTSETHEERLLSLFLLIERYRRSGDSGKKSVFGIYLKHTRYINNWDLVDLSAKHIVGDYLFKRDRSILYTLAASKFLWERRIAIVSTHYFIENNDLADTFRISRILLNDEHDLIHKAAGWMLREAGKRDVAAEEAFLMKHCESMPRTMLRYAIERFPRKRRLEYLNGNV